ncbi:hypothetical protein [Marinobacter sp. S6332]|uniref:hypothetical protein n=1 Tax=Marinobacter sp. S6332 TaxID=2926403 RepID=UPI001FF44D5A|nr:hypothetical protein [Marinobacter sp. S6332]MCK0163989.1 hypothetical protein [Marinobacter sp. S6332]
MFFENSSHFVLERYWSSAETCRPPQRLAKKNLTPHLHLVVLVFCIAFLFSPLAHANDPYLTFTDLVSGPNNGLNDGRGSGVIVTVWGQNLGSQQGASQLIITDASGAAMSPAHVYYWKNSDGQLPSGPANLFESHKMQEIAFSIPEGAEGPATIKIRKDGKQSNELSFTVRQGAIFHITPNGNDAGNGSFNDPWRTVNYAVNVAPLGSTIYVHDVKTGSQTTGRGIYWNNSDASSSSDAHFSILAYPDTRPTVIAQRAIDSFKTNGFMVSKLDVYASNYPQTDSNGQPIGALIDSFSDTWGIKTTKDGRYVANRIGDIPGGCASNWNGAIIGDSPKHLDRVSNAKMLGNEIYEYGCEGSNKLHHTTYLSIRSDRGMIVEPWEWGYNYLWGNKAKGGIHQWDKNETCGDMNGPLKIHHNVIVNQAGPGISVGAANNCSWSMNVHIYNNVLINTGLAAAWDGSDVDSSNGPENGAIVISSGINGLLGKFFISHNLIYKPASDGQTVGGKGCIQLSGTGDTVSVLWKNNICIVNRGHPFIGVGHRGSIMLDNIEGSNNSWFFDGLTASNSDLPNWDRSSVTEDPLVRFSGPIINYDPESRIIGAGSPSEIVNGIYGNSRTPSAVDIGPLQINKFENIAPKPPSEIFVD